MLADREAFESSTYVVDAVPSPLLASRKSVGFGLKRKMRSRPTGFALLTFVLSVAAACSYADSPGKRGLADSANKITSPDIYRKPLKAAPKVHGCGKILVMRFATGSKRSALVTLDISGGTRRLLRLRTSDFSSAVWSPSAQLIAFSQQSPDSNDNTEELFVVRADGSGLRRLTYGANVAISTLSWSPDGELIAFEDLASGKSVITIVDLQGKQHTLGAGEQPVWSPTNNLLAYARSAPTQTRDSTIHVVDDNGAPRDLGSGRNVPRGTSPTWSPDGREIVFLHYRAGATDIWIAPLKGNARRLLDRRRFEGAADLTWSPDGQHIAFSVKRDDYADVSIVARDGTNPRRLSPCCGEDPDWSPDSDMIAYESDRGIALLPLEHRARRRVILRNGSYVNGPPDWAPC